MRVTGVLATALLIAACGTGDSASPQYSADPPPTTRGAADDGRPASSTTGKPGTDRTPAQRGADRVGIRGCPTCHQSKDPNDGVLSGQSSPRPGTMAYGPNLTPDNDTGIGSWSDESIARAIRTGVDDQGAALCPPMPHFADVADEEAKDIVAYLRSLQPVARKAPDSACPGKVSTSDAGATTGDDAGDPLAPPDAGLTDAGLTDVGGPDSGCVGFAAPGARAACHACGTRACQANGCYGGYWCEGATATCHPKPATCP